MKAAGVLPVRKPESKVIADMRRVAESVRKIDGVDWYEGQIVCRALGMAPGKAYPRVQRTRKRYEWIDIRRYQKVKLVLIDRRGVEDLVIARGGLCRSRVMAELDAQMQRDSVDTSRVAWEVQSIATLRQSGEMQCHATELSSEAQDSKGKASR